MAMTKKEKEYVESLETRLALKCTPVVEPDVPVPAAGEGIVNGYGFNAYSRRILMTCSSMGAHARDRWHDTVEPGAIAQFSTRVLALKALRNALELTFAQDLRKVDLWIERETEGDDA